MTARPPDLTPSTSLTPPADVRQAILASVDSLNANVRSKSIDGTLDLFVPEAEVLLVGSSPGELARGPVALRALLSRVFESPYSIGWEWDERYVSAYGPVAWVYTEGALVMARDGNVVRRPYRMSGVLVRRPEGWRWAQFHGSEPAPE